MSGQASLLAAPGDLTADDYIRMRIALGDNFRPGTPITNRALFSGRAAQISSLIAAISQPGQHAVVFGERGVGKTSLAKVVTQMMSNLGMIVMGSGTVNCDGSDDFSSIWHKAFREISMLLRGKADAGFQGNTTPSRVYTLDSMLNERVSPDDVRFALSRLAERVIVVLDEVDKVRDRQTTTALLADTIKTLSDHAPNVTVILIGIADTVEGIIAEHKSVERSLIQVKMPRMEKTELNEVLQRGVTSAGITIATDAAAWITTLSQGLPHYTHMLGLYSALAAIDDGRTQVTMRDVGTGINQVVDRSHSLLTAYHTAVASPQRNNRYASVLLACATSVLDELGWFPAAAVAGPLSKVEGKRAEVPDFARHLREFCEARRGPVLEAKGDTRRRRYRFVDPMMQPFVVLHGYKDGMMPWMEDDSNK